MPVVTLVHAVYSNKQKIDTFCHINLKKRENIGESVKSEQKIPIYFRF